MAIFHLHITIGTKGKGQNAVAHSAYCARTKLYDEYTMKIFDFSRRTDLLYSEIALCAYAPTEYTDRETLWNAVHKIEKQKNAQLWREFEAALPIELHHDEHIQIVRNFVKRLTEQGMCVDWSIHDTGKGNPHVHMMCTMRSILPDGTWAAKSRKIYELDAEGNKIFQKIDKLGRKQYKTHKESFNNWSQKDCVQEWRIAWEKAVNAYLPEELHIDHRSYAEQGIDKLPTIHEGYGARGRERSGKLSDRCEYNRLTKLQNELQFEIQELKSKMELCDSERAKFREIVPKPDSKAILAKQEEHIQSVIQGDMPNQSEKSPVHQAYFTREQLHQLEHRLKEEQKKAEIQEKTVKRRKSR